MISLKRRQQRFNAGAGANAGLSDSSILNGQDISVSRINESIKHPIPPPTTSTLPVLPPRRATRSTRNVAQQPTMDQFFAAAEKSTIPTIPTKRKAAKATNASTRKPRKPAALKSRKSTVKVKEQLPSLENATLGKPEAWGKPEVWADKRQQLCSALPYYKGYESAAYRSQGMISGFLCNQGVGLRDVFTEDIYITKVGGGKEKGEDGETKQVKDQDTSSIAIAFQRTMEAKMPVAIIAGQRNSLSPVKLIHHFNVLDFFHVTDIWCELENGLKAWKVRMEKIDLTKRSWWSPIDSVAHLSQGYDGVKTVSQTCGVCNFSCKTMYTQGWTCQNPQCSSFYSFDGQVDVNDLQYCEDFLQERTQYTGIPPPVVRPEPITDADLVGEDAFGVEERCKQVPITKVLSRGLVCDDSPLDLIHKSVAVSQKPIGLYDVYELQIPGETTPAGWIQVFRSNGLINSQPGGPNDLFQGMQKDDYKLRRGPARHAGLPMEIVTAHFASNWGAPYKFLVAHEANSFEDAPVPVMKAMQRMTWAGKQAFSGHDDATFTPFNEVLCLGYFESMHIGYHDDGEDTLGENRCYLHAVTHHMDFYDLLSLAAMSSPSSLSPEDRAICRQKSALPANFADYAYDGSMDSKDPPPSGEDDDDGIHQAQEINHCQEALW
ncbi:hypothetical protein EYC84_008078 [Monilinia fructicola]|uniref:Alpha-ketoglutarate-dependent dioxygenase AlkB-like domain-containing protein n=1 Tax=Monilinia fructicola TaxID=38448 RepID=A0A5M9JGZ6_MONFR|nr:hypothetical protein EYC84_008078 [Monilinia fructicola]